MLPFEAAKLQPLNRPLLQEKLSVSVRRVVVEAPPTRDPFGHQRLVEQLLVSTWQQPKEPEALLGDLLG
jgi:hypothetical protein